MKLQKGNLNHNKNTVAQPDREKLVSFLTDHPAESLNLDQKLYIFMKSEVEKNLLAE